MIWLYYLVVVSVLSYFLFAKRVFDLLTIAALSSVIYFLPGLFGYVLYPLSTAIDEEVKFDVALIDEKTYIVFVFVLLIILISALLQDFIFSHLNKPGISFRGIEWIDKALLMLMIFSFILSILTTNLNFFHSDKTEVMKYLNRFYTLWTTLAIINVALAFMKRQWKIVVFSFALLLFDVYVGFRTSFSIAVITIFMLWLHEKGKQRLLINNFILACLGLFCASFIFLYKNLVVLVKLGQWGLVYESILSPDIYLKSITQSEPFITQAILNKIMDFQFFVGIEHFKYVAYQFIIFSPSLGVENKSFNDLFQPVLFPDLSFGMANNIWAEMYSSGGWGLLIAFIFLFNTLILIGCHYMRHDNKKIVALIAVISVYWAFYIHRNDLLYQINIEKNIIIFILLGYVFGIVLGWLKRGSMQNG